MHRIPRAAAALAALGLAAPAPLAAQQPASVQVEDALQTLDWLGQILLNAGMMAARSAADLTYESIELEKRSGGTITLVGLTVHPESNPMFPNMGWPEDAPECVITVERLEYAGLLAKWDGSGQSGAISLVGIDAPFTCLERGPASMLQGVGFDALRFERGEITYDYDYSTSALAASVTLSAPGAADIRIDADFDYAWVSDRRRGARSGPQPTLILDSADIRIDDRGGLEKARPILAQQGMSPEAVQAIVKEKLGIE